MGNPKQKWTSEEEEALRAGVKKHGIGKWKDIQKDPEFNPFLSSRSNIDLKDKWRNMTVSSMGPREKSRGTPKAKANQDAPAATQSVPQTSAAAPIKRDAPAPAPVRRDAPAPAPALVRCDATAPAPVRRDAPATPVRRDAPAAPVSRDAPAAPATDDSSTGLSDAITAPMYDAMIFEALSASTNPNGMDTGAIASFIEQRNDLPQNFRRAISNRLRRLVHQEKLEKIQNCFKLKTDFWCGTTKAPAPKQKDIIKPRQLQSHGATIEELATTIAKQIAESEEKFIDAENAMREAERLSLIAEDTESLLEFAKEILEQCQEGKVLLVA